MKQWIMDYICCPVCKGELRLEQTSSNETEILEGTLTCTKCERTYQISEGIAHLLPEN